MRLLRTAGGDFINSAAITRLKQHADDGVGWVAVLADGEEALLAPYYSTPGRVERDFPHLVPGEEVPAASTAVCGG